MTRSCIGIFAITVCGLLPLSAHAENLIVWEQDEQIYSLNNDSPKQDGRRYWTDYEVEPTEYEIDERDPSCTRVEWLGGIFGGDNGANCLRVCIKVPDLAEVQSTDFYVADPGGELQRCEGMCGIGWSKVYSTPEFYPDTSRVCGHFKNWSGSLERSIRFQVTLD